MADQGDMGALEPGELFAGRYLIERHLGEGDRKRTYLARDRILERAVALSVVKPDAVAGDPGGTEREARVLGRVGTHDNIVSIHDYEVHDTVQYIVFEYLSGGTLGDYLKGVGPLPAEELFRLAR